MDAISDQIVALAGTWWVLFAVLGVSVVDGFFPPIPSETVVIAVASVYASDQDWARAALLALVAAIGAAGGDNTAYWIGRIFKPQRWRVFSQGKGLAAYSWAERGFRRSGAPLLFAARYIPVGRVAVNVVAGSIHFPWRRFVVFDAFAALTWGIYSTVLGFAGGSVARENPLLAMGIGLVLGVSVGAIIQKVIGSRFSFDDPSPDAH